MILRLLAWLAASVRKHPGRVLAAVVVPALIASAIGAFVPTDLTFGGVIDRSDPLVKGYFDRSEQLNLGGMLPLLLEGQDDVLPSGNKRLDEAAEKVGAALTPLESVRSVITDVPVDWLKDNAPYIVDRDGFDAWLGLATRPEDAEAPKKLKAMLEEAQKEAERLRPEGRRVVIVMLTQDPLAYEAGGGFYYEIEEATLAALAPLEVTGSFAGVAAMGAQDQRQTLSRVQLLTPISLILVLLLFAFIEPNLVRLLVVAVPMGLTVGATLGITGVLLNGITILESFFGILVFGLGIDFALHLMVRLREERSHGQDFYEALHTTLTGAGRGIVAGAMTTAGAFFVVGLAPDPMAKHLGVSGAVGLLLCLILMLTFMPAAWTLLHHRAEARGLPTTDPRRTREVGIPLVDGLARHAARHPALHVVGALVFLVAAASGIPRFHYETDLTKVFNRDVPAVKAIARLQEGFGINAAPWITTATDLEQARILSDKLEALDTIATVESAGRLLPADAEQRRQAVIDAAKDIQSARVTYEALIPLTGEEEAEQMRGLLELLGILEGIGARPAPTPHDLPPSLKSRLVGPGGELLVYAYVKEPAFDGTQARLEREAVHTVAPDAVGFGLLVENVMAGKRDWAIPILFGVLLLVLFILAVDLRQPKMVVLALIPVLLGTLGTFGVLCWIGKPFSILQALIIPLILGLGVDDGIHVVHRLKEDRQTPPDTAASSVGKAIVMTTATTCTSFAALMFSNHPGMEGMALIMLIGLPICLLASITTLPAAAVLLRVNRAPDA